MPEHPFILGIGGGLRQGSSSEKALSVALGSARRLGLETKILAGPALNVPMYSPEAQTRTAEAETLVRLMRQCAGLIIASPAYHGGLSGLIKNALDYTEDMNKDPAPYLTGKAVGCIVCASGWQGVGSTLGAVRSIVHALRGWPTPLGAGVNVSSSSFAADGTCLDPSAQFQLETVGMEVAEFSLMQQAYRSHDERSRSVYRTGSA